MKPLHNNTVLDLWRDSWLGKRILVVGLGKTGLSCARFLALHNLDVAVTDTRMQPPGLDVLESEYPDVAAFVGGFDVQAFEHADILLVSPGVSLREPLIAEARARGVEILGDIELFARLVQVPVVAITGSNGKSTVTTLVGEMAQYAGRQVAVCGNIGTPVLDLFDDKYDLYVLELSSFQLETTDSLHACAATILNISEDHMDRYSSLADYSAAKAKIFHGDGTLVVNKDDPRAFATLEMISAGRKVIYFGLSEPESENDFGIKKENGQAFICLGQNILLPVSELRIKGLHNQSNALASLALGYVAGLPMSAMLEALRLFTGLPHRCQWLGTYQGVDWYNDSKGTNVGATVAAINGVEADKIVLIAGGQGKGQDFTPLQDAVTNKVRTVVLLGQDAPLIEKALANTVPVVYAKDMEEAVALAAEQAKSGDAVLLSPACASFDMFTGYDQRGDVFAMWVGKLIR
ncbi:MAG: UDP-N-acetylmuramoyl-L-alanine--D-glutamate ligase [Gammaproteobacteria bacterium]|nr:UDP-N-acetylmuramoyl-L-alanine--D-glutamate ligase [Gammaproteobacteria bacterium]